jgi:hypothetical protein
MSEEWHKTHAVLLKSVAEAQGKLLAGVNALETKLKTVEKRQDADREAISSWIGLAHQSLGGQIKGLGDGLADQAKENYQKLLLLIGICSAKPKRKSKRKPRGKGRK